MDGTSHAGSSLSFLNEEHKLHSFYQIKGKKTTKRGRKNKPIEMPEGVVEIEHHQTRKQLNYAHYARGSNSITLTMHEEAPQLCSLCAAPPYSPSLSLLKS
jgi:hypothetical protein